MPATLNQLLTHLKKEFPDADLEVIKRAYEFAARAHQGQQRTNGEPYITHCLATAMNLTTMHVDLSTYVAGLLHDVPEDTAYNLDDIEEEFGSEVATLVEGITKLGTLKYRGMERYVENLRKMFLALSKDLRVIFIKFADRLHNLETLDALPPDKRKRIALESMEIYAPIANRLGLWEVKGKLEDLSFKHIDAAGYDWTSKLVEDVAPAKEKVLARVMRKLENALASQPNLNVVSVQGRAKHLFSLYRKLLSHDKDITQIYDLIAVRVIVKDIAECYAALGLIHQLWKPLQWRFKDYIAQPKPNGYRSLHTAVFVGPGEVVEFQIRTVEMNNENEHGVAAHWFYTEQGKPKHSAKADDEQHAWVAQLLKLQQEIQDSREYLESLKIDVFRDSIFVFTPKGDVIALPDHATPVDFAYHIHSDLGNHCTAARVNNKLMPLSTPLRSGDMVEIIANKKRARPSPDWLHFVRTRSAREHIKSELSKSRKLFGFFSSQ